MIAISNSKVMIATTVTMVSNNMDDVKMADETILFVSIKMGKEKRSYTI